MVENKHCILIADDEPKMVRAYDTYYSDYFDYPYYHSYTMDVYQNLISGDK